MKVLIAEDDPAVRGLLAEILGQDGHDVVLAGDGDEAWKEYRDFAPDVVIADWMMPGSDGLELCRRIRTDPVTAYTYIVMVTGRAASADALEAIRAGADDHLPKPFSVESLEARLLAAARLVQLHQTLAAGAAAAVDAPPAPPAGDHRHKLISDLQALSDRTRRYGHRKWLAVVEVDRFDQYRQASGPEAADEVMARVGGCLAHHSRAGDSLHFLGEAQFLLVLPEQDDRSVQRVVARLRRAVEAMAIPHAHNRPKQVVTASVGLAVFEQHTHEGIGQTLYAASELALAARQAGGDLAMVAAARPSDTPTGNGVGAE